MKNIPWYSLGFGILLAFALYRFSPLDPRGAALLPLLASLFLSELGILITATGIFLAARDMLRNGVGFNGLAMALGNLMLLLNFAYIGLELWAKSQLVG